MTPRQAIIEMAAINLSQADDSFEESALAGLKMGPIYQKIARDPSAVFEAVEIIASLCRSSAEMSMFSAEEILRTYQEG